MRAPDPRRKEVLIETYWIDHDNAGWKMTWCPHDGNKGHKDYMRGKTFGNREDALHEAMCLAKNLKIKVTTNIREYYGMPKDYLKEKR